MRKSLVVLSGAILLSLIVTVIPLATGCTPKAAVEEKYVTHLNLADLTGPTAAVHVPVDKGASAYLKGLNEKGGIDGVKVKYIVVDTRYDTARTVAAYQRYRTEHKVLFVQAPSTAGVKALAPFLQEDKGVGYGPPDGELQAFPGRYFLMGPSYQDGFAALLDWIVADWKAKGKTGMPKVGHMGWDNPYGREPLRGGKEYAEKLGLTLLPPEFFPAGSLKHDVYLTRLANAGANYIHVGGVDQTPTNVIRDAQALGLTKSIQFAADFWGPSEAFGVKAYPEALEGTVIYSYYLRGEEARNHPLGKLWVEYGYGSPADMPDPFVLGITQALGFEAGVRRALQDVGYEKLDGEAMFQAMQKLTGMDINKGLTGSCAWAEGERRASRFVKLYQIKSGKVVPITDWAKAPDAVALYKW
ncbi:MAG: hypothetical protein FJZ94_06340 [Chloroflexi bacterium]|nr:hypothetical protein [Chloroflexota bacterium]MBM4451073.1 hypothetical protein [Chloroflexota bacterium]